MNPSTEEFEKALKALDIALKEPLSDLIRDATIQRFEFCVELAWKTSRRVLGFKPAAPRVVIRDMANANLIDDADLWFKFLDARNESSHTYKEEIAVRVYQIAKDFLPHGLDLLQRLKNI